MAESARSQQELIQKLKRLTSPDQVLHSQSAMRAYDCDAYTVDRSKPWVVVLPESTAEVARIVRLCVERGVPFTPRGAGTGLSGGSMAAAGGVLISTKKLTKILEIDSANRCLLAQAGVPNKRLSDAVAQYGLHFAPDPSSQSVSTLGGNIAENSGGPHTLKYGVTVQHILGVTMVDPNGEVLQFGGKVDGAPGFDFLGLIVGGEGTLGIVTEAWIKLTPLPKAVKTALAAFPEVRGAAQTVSDLIAQGVIPAAMEIMDRGILKALRAAFGLEYPDGTDALLLIECDGDPDAVPAEMAAVEKTCAANGAIEVKLAKDEAERLKLWTARKKGIGAMGRLAPSIVTHDGVIPRSKLPEMLAFCYQVAKDHDLGIANLFHAGDGNLHPCFYFDDRDPDQVKRVIEAGEIVLRKCIELGGSITGEHGVGVEKVELLVEMLGPGGLHAQTLAKRIFNEGELCNPCKVLPNQKGCVEHKKRWRGVAW